MYSHHCRRRELDGGHFPDLYDLLYKSPSTPLNANEQATITRWWALPTNGNAMNSPTGSLSDGQAGAFKLVKALTGSPTQGLALWPLEEEAPLEAKRVGPLPSAVNVHFDGQGWVVSAEGLIRPFRFAGHIAADIYAEQVGGKYGVPVVQN
jgi:hypothetical protein